MSLPFTQEQFLEVFARYNRGIWPAQVLAIAICLYLVGIVVVHKSPNRGVVLSLLAGLWLLNGIGYHWMYFAAINPAAKAFGALFVIQALVLLWAAAKSGIQFGIKGGFPSGAGWTMVVYAVIAYPLLGFLAGHTYPNSPILGVAPCPTTIFTLGFLLAFARNTAKMLFVIPIVWSLIGMTAAISLGIWEDVGLGVSGLLALALLLSHRLEKAGAAPAGAPAV